MINIFSSSFFFYSSSSSCFYSSFFLLISLRSSFLFASSLSKQTVHLCYSKSDLSIYFLHLGQFIITEPHVVSCFFRSLNRTLVWHLSKAIHSTCLKSQLSTCSWQLFLCFFAPHNEQTNFKNSQDCKCYSSFFYIVL